MTTYSERVNVITQRYNQAIRNMEDQYHMQKAGNWSLSSHLLRQQYSDRYDSLVQAYRHDCRQALAACAQADPEWAKWRQWWSRIFVGGLLALMVGCMATMPDEPQPQASSMMSATEQEQHYWNADNIPIPYLQDSTQYVSNPDGILSQQTVDNMNVTLSRLENNLNVQSVVIVVNHIENDDPFRMAQDVGNKYGVGYNDRGLVVVVGYGDHSINISPGRSLEADLTDAECHRLEQRYVVPAMRAEMPDSAMLYLTEAIYSTLEQKELPVMSSLVSADDAYEDQVATNVGIFMLLLIGWALLFVRLNSKYQWLGLVGAVHLLANPFIDRSVHFSSGGGGGFGGDGGGFSGGSFGGGSFGGGGATSRW